MTKTITLPHWEIFVVEADADAKDFKIFHDIGRPYLSYFVGVETKRIYLPPGNWQIVGITPLTEEQAGMVVEKFNPLFWVNYNRKYEEDLNIFDTATESFASLLKANGVDSSKRLVVLKSIL